MSDRGFSLIALILACAVTLVHSLWMDPWMLDDAFIFFRYAENWAAGHGPLFNLGEPAVEGYTSFFWLALLTIGKAVGVDVLVCSQVLGHTAALLTLLLVSRSHRIVDGIDQRSAAWATLFLGTCGAFTPWARSGMETALHALLTVFLVIRYLHARRAGLEVRNWIVVGLTSVALVMNRPDGLLVVAVLALECLLVRRWRGFLATGITFAVVFGSYFAWRYSYFGEVLPNTFHVKVGATSAQVARGLSYAGDAALALLPLALLPLLFGRTWFGTARNLLVVPGVILLHTLYVVAVGGDVMPAFRFFTPILPLLCLLAGAALSRWPHRAQIGGAAVAVAYSLVMLVAVISPVIRGDTVAYNGRIAGEWLRENAKEGEVIATNTAGTVIYYSGLRAIDMLGLNDLHIARVEMPDLGAGHAGHEKGDGAYVLSKRPEFIQLGSSAGWAPTEIEPQPPFPGDRQLWNNPAFHDQYELVYREGATVWPNWARLGYFGFYVRKDVAARFKKDK